MPVLNSHTAFELARGLKAFLNVRFGVTWAEVRERKHAGTATGELDRPERVMELERELAVRDREIARLRSRAGDRIVSRSDRIPSDKLVWIFGTARVGSTWLATMMEDLKEISVWHEPIVGELFGTFYYIRASNRRGKHFIMGDRYKETWLASIRELVLAGASDRFPEVVEKGRLFVKEPNGSIGAPLLMEALPESSMILLVRDPRDVVASALDSSRDGGWLSKRTDDRAQDRAARTERNPNGIVKVVSERYVQYIGNSRLAYEAHEGPKVLVKYEDLRADTLKEMRRIYSTLGVPFDEAELAGVVEKHSWENIPEDQKGEGKFYRKGSPGSWREDLTPEQIDIVEGITAPLIEKFYPDR